MVLQAVSHPIKSSGTQQPYGVRSLHLPMKKLSHRSATPQKPLRADEPVKQNGELDPSRVRDISLWLTSPLAQDLFFGGVIYRLLRPHFSGRVYSWLPFEWVLPVGGLFFADWHVQNFAYFPVWYVFLQLLYTWAAYTFVGLTRQWTGTILYVVLGHMAGNFVAWYVD